MARIGSAVRESGIKIANSSLRDVIRAEREIWQHGLSLKFAPRKRPIDVTRLPEALGKIRRRYSYVVEVKGALVATGDETTQHVTVTTNKHLTPEQILKQAQNAVDGGGARYGIVVAKTTIIQGIRAGRYGTF